MTDQLEPFAPLPDAESNASEAAVSPDGPPKTRETSFVRWIIETALLVLLAFALAQGIKAFVVQPFVIPTGSMRPTIMEGNRVLAEKLTFRFGRGPVAGDIVVFDDPMAQHPQLIKRVIATEGQTVEIRDDLVYVDGEKLDEPYVHGRPSVEGSVPLPVVVPPGNVWLMGDNRPASGDSRFFGPRPVETVRGRAFWTYWPPTQFGALD
ncbi:MAG: signal peptidase I [Coriobacteriia bacterium]|nr:signal peptidase I [Coriobacteriia bacterium]